MDQTITKQEQEALSKFRERVSDLLSTFREYQNHDMWLLRWLRARELNVGKAEEMLRKSLKWREEEGLDDLLSWKVPDYIDQEFPMQAPGFDKDGCVVAVVPFGTWDIKKACTLGHKKDVIRFVGQVFEQAMKFLELRTTKEHFLYQFVLILDFDGFGLSQVASKDKVGNGKIATQLVSDATSIDTISEILKNFEANYPETLKAAWVVQAPKYFEILFKIIKPIMTARTISKIFVHGTGGWRGPLLQQIDADQLPSQCGGSITTCREYKVRYGFDVFKTYETFPESEMTAILLAAGTKHSVENKLSVGSHLSYNFRSEDYDIGFSLQFQADGDDKVVTLFSCDKVDSHIHIQKGAMEIEKAGTYTLVLDNSYSRLRSKNVYYAVRVKTAL